MMYRSLRPRLSALIITFVFLSCCLSLAHAQSKETPLTSQELVKLLYQFHDHPNQKSEIIEEIRRRGLGFELTQGLRSVVATKSGNDAELRRTIEEAARRRVNPAIAAPPSETEARDVLAQSKAATLAAVQAMPDFIVKQQITRSYAYNNTNNWSVADRLTVAVSYRASAGEEYKLMAVNGMPTSADSAKEGQTYEQVGGTSSTGEYVSMLSALFQDESRTEFKAVDTDTLRGRRAIVYEFEVLKPFSHLSLKAKGLGLGEQETITGHRGRVWIDRETFRILRLEDISTEIPKDFPIVAASSLVDYDWVTIAEKQYLLPTRADIVLGGRQSNQIIQSRNEIRFRNYQKFGTEVKITEDTDFSDMDEKPEEKPKEKKEKP
ncbi:MAG: hypothetical protein WBP93_22225 [Pyrinomonadaceae bacterium]